MIHTLAPEHAEFEVFFLQAERLLRGLKGTKDKHFAPEFMQAMDLMDEIPAESFAALEAHYAPLDDYLKQIDWSDTDLQLP